MSDRANSEEAGYRLAANESHGIGSVHRPVSSLLMEPAILAVLEAFPNMGISIVTTLLCLNLGMLQKKWAIT